MTFTQAQHDALEAAIAEGVLVVVYEDRKVTYRTQTEMERALRRIKLALGLIEDRPDRRLSSHKKGVE